jgi:peroxiredoxin
MKLVVTRPWMQLILLAAGIYNLIWGFTTLFYPQQLFNNLHLQLPNYILMWQGIAMVEILFGFGYLLASNHPFKHWIIVLLGLLLKTTIALGFVYFWWQNKLPISLFPHVLANDIIWIIPFSLISYYAFEYAQCNRELSAYNMQERKLKSLDSIITNQGLSLAAYSDEKPTMLIFLRHFGCTFCKEALREIKKNRAAIESEGTQIILVHLVDELEAAIATQKYHIADLPRISDPEKKLYKAFGLQRGTFVQLLGLNVILRGAVAGLIKGNFPEKPKADPFQMPGVFLLFKGAVLQTFKHTTSADRPDYIELAKIETKN